MKRREAWNLIAHIVVGCALTALVLWNRYFLLLATFVYMVLREQAQHRYIFEQWDEESYLVDKRTFFDFGWVTGHRVWEVFQSVLGCAIALGAYELFT